MADDKSDPSENEHGGRAHHQPQHASAKHFRPQADKTDSDFTITDNSGTPDNTPGEDEPAHTVADDTADTIEPATGPQPHHRLWQWVKSNKKMSVPLIVVVVLGLLAAIPPTRYLLAGTVLRQNFSVLVTDSQTHKPVTSASVILEGKSTVTNNKGVATLKVKVGRTSLNVSKKYYTSAAKDVLVPIGSQKQHEEISLAATGRQVPVVVHNKISGQPASNVTVSAQGTEAKTDAHGELTLVLPAGKASVAATLSGNGYNKAAVTIKVTPGVDPANTFPITPSGKLYFLSNKTGTIDVVKTDLDGANRQTVLAGTGTEDKNDTVLLASQDWRYLALLSKRDGGDNAKLFLINTSTSAVTTMDEGDVDFTLTGWSGHSFVYLVNRHNTAQWQANRQAIKSYDADSAKLNTLDQTTAGGTSDQTFFSEDINGLSILAGEVVYGKEVFASSSNDMGNHQATLNSVKPDGSDKQAVKSWSSTVAGGFYNTVSDTVNTRQTEPGSLYVTSTVFPSSAPNQDKNLYEYADGKLTTVSGKTADDIYNSAYLTYLLSPSNTKTFWSEPRDGKNTLFVGDDDGKNGQEVASLSDYQTYGWYTEKYLLMSKNASELYITSVTGGTPLKITDYYKPAVTFPGYGGGYGGF